MAAYHAKLPSFNAQQIATFLLKVQLGIGNKCWEWSGTKDYDRYGIVTRKLDGKTRRFRAHRVAYLLYYGTDPGKFLVCHTCDNPPCCNPDHLFLGTEATNMTDKTNKGRQPRGKTHGAYKHPERFQGRKGDAHPLSVLTDAQSLEILSRITGARGECGELACEYGVSRTTISSLKHGTRRKHLPRNSGSIR